MAGVVWDNGRHILSDGKSRLADFDFTKTLNVTGTNAAIEARAKLAADTILSNRGLPWRTWWHLITKSPLNYTLWIAWDGVTAPSGTWWTD